MTEIVTYREKPLSIEDFHKLESLAQKHLVFKERLVSKSVPKVDSQGNTYGWERDLVPMGTEVQFRSAPPENLMDSLQRPATRQAIAKHLTDMAAHRPYARGEGGFLTVVQDLINDLNGCSEWAILKTCETFRLQKGEKFFPNTAELVHAVKSLDESLRWAYAARPSQKKKPDAKTEPELHVYTTKKKIQVNRMCKLAMKPRANWTRWEVRFFDGAKKERFVPKHQPPAHNFGYKN